MNNADANSASVRFDYSTVIVKYLHTQARNYNNHKKVMMELYSRHAYPAMRLYFLRKAAEEGKYEFLIVKTGPLEEFRKRKASTPELKRAIEAAVPGGTFTDIHGDGNVADTADLGPLSGPITSTTEFEQLRAAIENGAFSIEEVLEYDNPELTTPSTSPRAMLADTRLVGTAEIDADPSLLIAHGDGGYTPLHWAAIDGRLRDVELFVNRGAEIDAVDNEGCTALQRALLRSPRGSDRTESGHSAIVNLLISRGANVSVVTDEDGYTPLHLAAFVARVDYISLLLDKGADIQARSVGGFTPLHSAATSGFVRVAELLISRGADVLSRTNDGKSVADVADDCGHSSFAWHVRVAEKAAR